MNATEHITKLMIECAQLGTKIIYTQNIISSSSTGA